MWEEFAKIDRSILIPCTPLSVKQIPERTSISRMLESFRLQKIIFSPTIKKDRSKLRTQKSWCGQKLWRENSNLNQ